MVLTGSRVQHSAGGPSNLALALALNLDLDLNPLVPFKVRVRCPGGSKFKVHASIPPFHDSIIPFPGM